MGNILDIILTDSPDLVSEHIVHKREDNLHSDHYLISLYLTSNSVSVYSAPSDPSYNFLRADWAGLIDFLNDRLFVLLFLPGHQFYLDGDQRNNCNGS